MEIQFNLKNCIAFLSLFIVWLLTSCQSKSPNQSMEKIPNLSAQEKQLTFEEAGHFLNQRQVFSPNDEWVVFDGRNDDSKIGENGNVGLLNLESGEIIGVYSNSNQSHFGPGAGAVSYHPLKEEVIFIRGLLNANQGSPYHITRRSAIGLDLTDKQNPNSFHADARDVSAPFTTGALRGGTHAFSYSGDGDWISYTYNDEVLEIESHSNPEVKDLRTIGVMIANHPVQVDSVNRDAEFGGTHFSVLAARVNPKPKPGSDEIQKAYEECWIGTDGYINSEGKRIKRALAFLGDVIDENGNLVTELFVSDLPDDPQVLMKSPNLKGTRTSLPEVPESIQQRRITFSTDQQFPGIQGPRQWLRSSPNGDRIYFYAKGEDGIVQIFFVSPNGGKPIQVTHLAKSPETMFSLSPDGDWLAFGFDNQVLVASVASGEIFTFGSASDGTSELCNINWSHSGDRLVYNRKVASGSGSYFQIFERKPFN